MTRLSDFRARPTLVPSTGGGEGGGSGTGIKGNWNVTPRWAPGYSKTPGFSFPTLPLPAPNSSNFASFDPQTLTIESSIADITTDTPPSTRSAAAIWNMNLDIANTVSGSHRFRITFGNEVLGSTAAPIFGIVRDDFANPDDLDVLILPIGTGQNVLPDTGTPGITKDYNECSAFLAVSAVASPTQVAAAAFGRAGLNTYPPEVSTTEVPLMSSGNTMDCYISWVDGGTIDPMFAGVKFVFLGVIITGDGGSTTAYSAFEGLPPEVLPTNRTMVPFFGISSFNTGSYPPDFTVVGDYEAAPTIIPPGSFDIPDVVVNAIVGTPQTFGVVVPDVFTQVTSLPNQAAVNEQYIAITSAFYKAGYPTGVYTVTSVADADNYTMSFDAVSYDIYRPDHGLTVGEELTIVNKSGPVNEVKPFGEWAIEGDVILIKNITPGQQAIDVYNEWRDKGGELVTTLDQGEIITLQFPPSSVTSGAAVDGNTISPSNRVSALHQAAVDLTFPPNIPEQDKYVKFRIEVKPGNTTLDKLYMRIENASITSGSREVEYSPSNFIDGTNNGSLNVTLGYFPESVNILHPAIPATATAYNYYRKVKLVSPAVTADPLYQITDVGASVSANFHYYDEASSTVYIGILPNNDPDAIHDPNNPINQAFQVGATVSYNSGVDSAVVEASSNVLMLSEPATATAVGEIGLIGAASIGGSGGFLAVSSPEFTQTVSGDVLDQVGTLAEPFSGVYFLPGVPGVYPASGVVIASQSQYHPFPESMRSEMAVWIVYQEPGTGSQSYSFMNFYPADIGLPPAANSFIALEVDSLAKTLTIKYKDTNDDEQSIVLDQTTFDLATSQASGVADVVYSTISGPTGVITFYGLSNFDVGDTIEVVFVPNREVAGVPGFNQVLKTTYVQGTDFDITGPNTIQMAISVPNPTVDGRYFVRKVFPTGFSINGIGQSGSPTITSFDNIIGFFGQGQNRTIVSLVTTQSELTANILAEFFERPNPDPAIFGVEFETETLTPTEGQLYTVPERYDPTLNKEMVWQTKNALALVSKDGVFKGKTFKAGNFARWNGIETVPFPLLPAELPPVVPGTYAFEVREVDNTTYTVTEADFGKIIDLVPGTTTPEYIGLPDPELIPAGTWVGITTDQVYGGAVPYLRLSSYVIPDSNDDRLHCLKKVVFILFTGNGPGTAAPYFQVFGNYPQSQTAFTYSISYTSGMQYPGTDIINKNVMVHNTYGNITINIDNFFPYMQEGKDSIVVTNLGTDAVEVLSAGYNVYAVGNKTKITSQYKSMVLRKLMGALIVDGGETTP